MQLMKCELCKKALGKTFLEKIVGTYIKDAKGKKHLVCFECQKKLQGKDKILAELK